MKIPGVLPAGDHCNDVASAVLTRSDHSYSQHHNHQLGNLSPWPCHPRAFGEPWQRTHIHAKEVSTWQNKPEVCIWSEMRKVKYFECMNLLMCVINYAIFLIFEKSDAIFLIYALSFNFEWGPQSAHPTQVLVFILYDCNQLDVKNFQTLSMSFLAQRKRGVRKVHIGDQSWKGKIQMRF